MSHPPPSYSPVMPAEHSSHLADTPPRPWRPGLVRRLPWTGLISLVLALAFAIAAVCVGLRSDGKELDYLTVRSHSVSPAVLLSIFVTLANSLLLYAFTQGATVHWWRTAFEGTTLAQLHSSYHYGDGMTAIFTSATAFNTVALAGIVMPFLLADGPLLQRSLSVEQEVVVSHANRTIPISPSPWILGSTGIISDHESDTHPNLYHPLFARVLQQYTNREPVLMPAEVCTGECRVEIVAPGWDVECFAESESYALASLYDQAEMYAQGNLFANGTQRPNSTYHGPQIEQTVYQAEVVYNFTRSASERLASAAAAQFALRLKTTYKSTLGIEGTLSHHECWLREAIVRYPVTIANTTVALAPMPASENRTVERVLRRTELTGQGDNPSTLGGFWLALRTKFHARATFRPAGSYYKVSTTAASSSQYLRAPNASALSTYDVTWDDPMADMILMANELAFRTAVTTSTLAPGGVSILATLHHSKADWWNLTSEQPYVISPNLTSVQRAVEQTALVTASMPVAVYVTHRGWLAGGFTVMCVACLAIAPTYWGWWRLGRKVSMSPLEIARAFDAPVLREAPHNATGDDVKKILGPKRVNLAPASAGGTQEERIALTQHNPKMDGETTITR